MPIYAYKCSACGFAKDVLQKISDAPLTVCPECGASAYSKQVTAAGFQLKGSGWYVTDFRNNGNGNAANGSTAAKKDTGADSGSSAKEATAESKPADSSSSGASSSSGSSNASPAAPAPAAKPASPAAS
ncbi:MULTISPECIES: FmdB family zinc ribbon protein [unclassified Achromobacter]|uniref:FmdB family zinc ribbon protein n=1 Tax=unclassified Achromobacter TaxID=2626865 RepID=UPI000B51E05F|nr:MULTISPECIES: FmdB family zinc ribbon protein [unclassified Achromobacter]OWT74982.1 FmdB family transcriptional regulator [Achromobacter sp. HZ28]OWT76590.1 FmdB family transcriptional regulator [Achromobacter sp. HZ34]